MKALVLSGGGALGAYEAGSQGSTGNDRQAVGLHEIRPKTPLPISVLQFDDQLRINEVFDRGVEDPKALVAGAQITAS